MTDELLEFSLTSEWDTDEYALVSVTENYDASAETEYYSKAGWRYQTEPCTLDMDEKVGIPEENNYVNTLKMFYQG